MKNLFFSLVALLLVLDIALPPKLSILLDRQHEKVMDVPFGYAVRYFAKAKDGGSYYVVIRSTNSLDDRQYRLFTGPADSLHEVPILHIFNGFSVVQIKTASFTLFFPTTPYAPWITGPHPDAGDEDPDDSDRNLVLLPNG